MAREAVGNTLSRSAPYMCFLPRVRNPPLSGTIFVLDIRGFQAGLALSEPHKLCKLERVLSNRLSSFSDPLSSAVVPQFLLCDDEILGISLYFVRSVEMWCFVFYICEMKVH